MLKLDKTTLAKTVIWAPSSWQAWYYFGFALNNQTDNKQASLLGEECVTRAAELDPNNYRLWLELGKLRQQLNMIPEARVAFSKAKALRFWVNVPDLPDN
jgi:Flp pilus assembly protein TadD